MKKNAASKAYREQPFDQFLVDRAMIAEAVRAARDYDELSEAVSQAKRIILRGA